MIITDHDVKLCLNHGACLCFLTARFTRRREGRAGGKSLFPLLTCESSTSDRFCLQNFPILRDYATILYATLLRWSHMSPLCWPYLSLLSMDLANVVFPEKLASSTCTRNERGNGGSLVMWPLLRNGMWLIVKWKWEEVKLHENSICPPSQGPVNKKWSDNICDH